MGKSDSRYSAFGAEYDDRGRVTNAPSIRITKAGEFKSRCEDLFGTETRLAPRLQIAFGRGHTCIDDWLADKKVPDLAWDILEILEATPKNRWPSKWRAARSYRVKASEEYTQKTTGVPGHLRLNRGPDGDPRAQELQAKIHQMLIEGSSTADAARETGVNSGTIASWRAIGKVLPSSRLYHVYKKMAAARDMRRDGETYDRICEKLDLSYGRVQNWARADWKYGGRTPEELHDDEFTGWLIDVYEAAIAGEKKPELPDHLTEIYHLISTGKYKRPSTP